MTVARSIPPALGLAALLFQTSCATDEGDEALAWSGEEAHLRLRGNLNGERYDIDISGSAASADKLFCELEYYIPLIDDSDPENPVGDFSMAVNTEAKILAIVDVDGEQRYLSLELKAHSFQSDAEGTRITIVPRSETMDPAADEMWFEFEWLDGPDGEEIFESSANEGVFTLELLDGEPPADTIVFEEGAATIGGHLTATWSATESVELEFTAPCTAIDLDIE